MKDAQVEYVGFKTEGSERLYTLCVRRPGGGCDEFTVAIPLDAFLAHRIRFQDAPDLCFLKLQRELAGCPERLLGAHLSVSDAELEEYRAAHAPKPPNRRPRAPDSGK